MNACFLPLPRVSRIDSFVLIGFECIGVLVETPMGLRKAHET